MPTVVTFGSGAFNTSQERDYFINPGLFGDDACRWIIQRLRERGIETDAEPDSRGLGWCFEAECLLPQRPHQHAVRQRVRITAGRSDAPGTDR